MTWGQAITENGSQASRFFVGRVSASQPIISKELRAIRMTDHARQPRHVGEKRRFAIVRSDPFQLLNCGAAVPNADPKPITSGDKSIDYDEPTGRRRIQRTLPRPDNDSFTPSE
jgi:hypothetical protein